MIPSTMALKYSLSLAVIHYLIFNLISFKHCYAICVMKNSFRNICNRHDLSISCTSFSSARQDLVSFDYHLLDCGDLLRLEKFGNLIVKRSCPTAVWTRDRSIAEWETPDLTYEGISGKGGSWTAGKTVVSCSDFNQKNNWQVKFGDNFVMQLYLSENGQVGVFPEQEDNWKWIKNQMNKFNSKDNYDSLKILNGFAYTGGSTLASLSAGNTEVVHLDAAKSFLKWTSENIQLSNITNASVKYRADDCLTFLEREIRRGQKYHGLIFDPPAFGRGANGKTWKLDRDLSILVDMIPSLLCESPAFVLLSCHDQKLGSRDLAEMLKSKLKGKVESGSMTIKSEFGANSLPLGSYARWTPR